MSSEDVTIQEINSQPAALEAILDALGEAEPKLAESLSPDTTFCTVGCGTSYYLSQTGSSILNEVASSVAIPGSEAFISPDQLPNDVDVIVPVSRSGESTETVRATETLCDRYPDATVLGLTCTEGSSIYELSDIPILSPEGSEESVVMTKSFSSMLVAFEYIARVIETGGESAVADEFESVPADSEQVISHANEPIQEIANDDFEKTFFLGSGEHFGVASEAMLKLEEMTLTWTKAYHALEFRHGPQSIADENTLVTVFLPDRQLELYSDLLNDIADLEATSLVIGTSEALKKVDADYAVEIPTREFGSLPLYAPSFQLLGYYKAVANGLNPDDPQNLTQVVTL